MIKNLISAGQRMFGQKMDGIQVLMDTIVVKVNTLDKQVVERDNTAEIASVNMLPDFIMSELVEVELCNENIMDLATM